MSTTKKTAKPAAEAPAEITARTKCLLNLREKPSMEAEIIRTIEKNTSLKVRVIRDGWAELKDGFVKEEFLEVLKNAESGKI